MHKFHRRHAIKPHKSLRLFHLWSASMRCALFSSLFCHWIICHHILEGAVPCLSAQTSIISWCRMELYFFHGWPSLKNGRFLPLAMSIYPNEWVGCFAFEQLWVNEISHWTSSSDPWRKKWFRWHLIYLQIAWKYICRNWFPNRPSKSQINWSNVWEGLSRFYLTSSVNNKFSVCLCSIFDMLCLICYAHTHCMHSIFNGCFPCCGEHKPEKNYSQTTVSISLFPSFSKLNLVTFVGSKKLLLDSTFFPARFPDKRFWSHSVLSLTSLRWPKHVSGSCTKVLGRFMCECEVMHAFSYNVHIHIKWSYPKK